MMIAVRQITGGAQVAAENRPLRAVPAQGAHPGAHPGAQQVHTPALFPAAPAPPRRLTTAEARAAIEQAWRDGRSLAEGAQLSTRSRSRVKAVYDELTAAQAATGTETPEPPQSPAQAPSVPVEPEVVFIGRCGPNPPVHSGWWTLRDAQAAVERVARGKRGHIDGWWASMEPQGFPTLWAYRDQQYMYGTVERVTIRMRES